VISFFGSGQNSPPFFFFLYGPSIPVCVWMDLKVKDPPSRPTSSTFLVCSPRPYPPAPHPAGSPPPLILPRFGRPDGVRYVLVTSFLSPPPLPLGPDTFPSLSLAILSSHHLTASRGPEDKRRRAPGTNPPVFCPGDRCGRGPKTTD